jgi:hypothetical protein
VTARGWAECYLRSWQVRDVRSLVATEDKAGSDPSEFGATDRAVVLAPPARPGTAGNEHWHRTHSSAAGCALRICILPPPMPVDRSLTDLNVPVGRSLVERTRLHGWSAPDRRRKAFGLRNDSMQATRNPAAFRPTMTQGDAETHCWDDRGRRSCRTTIPGNRLEAGMGYLIAAPPRYHGGVAW